MNIKNAIYLFYGFGAEYVLHPLYTELKSRRKECVEIDALTIGNSRNIINKLKGTDVVFVTSAHFLMDQKNFTDFYPTTKKFYSVLEIIALLKPIKTVYIPHDLTQPLIDYETEYLNQIDLFLTPSEPYTSIYSQFCRVEEIGWIKYQASSNQEAKKRKNQNANKALWLISDYVLHKKMGVEASFEATNPILKQGVSIKFPIWFDTSKFESYYIKKGAFVYPSATNTIDLILQHDIIITNGLSSIIAESYLLGKTTVNIMQYAHFGNELEYLHTNFPDMIFYENIVDFKLSQVPKKTNKPTLKPFDMQKAIDLITN